jgi:hypothetical protein
MGPSNEDCSFPVRKVLTIIDIRTSPFIFSRGKALHLAIDKQHWFQIEGPASDAVLILLAAYYHVLD